MARKSKEVATTEAPVVEVVEKDLTLEQQTEAPSVQTTEIEQHKDTDIVDELVDGEVVQLSGVKYKVSKEGGLTFFDPV